MTKVGFISLGCPKNLVDSEVMMGLLSREGYDPNITADAIYFDDRISQAFVKLDTALYERLQTGNVRL